MGETYFRVELPDELIGELLQTIRDFDTRYDPHHEGRVHFESLMESDFPTDRMAAVFRAITPPPQHLYVKRFGQDYEDSFEQLGVKSLVELVEKYDREVERFREFAKEIAQHLYEKQDFARVRAMATELLSKSDLQGHSHGSRTGLSGRDERKDFQK